MDFFGNFFKGVSTKIWLLYLGISIFIVFLTFIVPIRKPRSPRTTGGGTSTFTFRVFLRSTRVFGILLGIVSIMGLIMRNAGLLETQGAANWFGIFIFLFVFIVLIPLFRQIRTYDKGSEGEELVERELEKLKLEYFIFHDVFTGRGNVDHIVIGPTGIFTVETKNLRGVPRVKGENLYVGKRSCNYQIRQAFAEAMAIRDFLLRKGLNLFVTPILCLSQKRAREFIGKVRKVWVMGLDQIYPFIQSSPPALEGTKLKRAKEALEELKMREKTEVRSSPGDEI